MSESTAFEQLSSAITRRKAVAGVIGLGYVGLPLAAAIARQGFRTIGFDTDPSKPPRLNRGDSYIGAVPSAELAALVDRGSFTATNDFERLEECDVLVICVPTPLTRQRQPDLSYVESSAKEIARRLRRGQLVVLESTTYPGTTREVLKPILESSGLTAGRDFFIGFSPEREDPGNSSFGTATIPKVVAGMGAEASRLIESFYSAVVNRIVPVSSPDVAEAVKITENIFRAVNIALVNELKLIFSAMGIDIWEVIEAAGTKPFGYMPFYPGPGLGGHCIPIDPFYLAWKSREYDLPTRFIELAGEINVAMPAFVIAKLAEALDRRFGKALSTSKILLLGLAYKKNVSDIRESPSLRLMELLRERGAQVLYHDPYVEEIPPTREHSRFAGLRSETLNALNISGCDAVLIATDHDQVDYAAIRENAKLIIDTRNVMARKGLSGTNVVKA
jgi:UDP-N-acetyl-D-glucosamine dehydrogenase